MILDEKEGEKEGRKESGREGSRTYQHPVVKNNRMEPVGNTKNRYVFQSVTDRGLNGGVSGQVNTSRG